MIISTSVVALLLSLIFKSWVWGFLEIFFYSASIIFFWRLLDHKADFHLINDFISFDFLSLILIILTFFISALIFSGRFTSVYHARKNVSLFSLLCFLMAFFLLVSFSSLSVINFYVFFEASLIPIFLLVLGWGYQPERLQAGIYILFYTLFASLPLLLVILYRQENFKIFLAFKRGLHGESILSFIFVFFIVFAFLVKLPIFGVHLWLPKAHVEAPVAGSIILAGVLLKLGRYGIWRVLQYVYSYFAHIRYYTIILGLVGGLIVRFVCTVQVDIKSLVAYSSVVHIGILLAGIRTLFVFGFEGSLCIILGHGLVSSGLFFLVGSLYDRIGSRRLLINKGQIIIFPFMTIFWFILCIFNIRAPPSISLLREILLAGRIMKWRSLTFFSLIAINFIGIVFTFYIYSQRQQGKLFSSLVSVYQIRRREVMVALIHRLRVLILLGVFWLFYLCNLSKIWNCDFQNAYYAADNYS